jgi:hypothetical protein
MTSDQDRSTPAVSDYSWVARPTAEHQWLEQFIGEWEFSPPPPPGAEAPPAQQVYVQTFRSLRGIWFIGEGEMPEPDGTIGTTITTLGYDPARNRFVGTWIGSMMSHLWIYEGELDAERRTLSLYTEGPDMSGDSGLVQYCDAFEIVDPGHYVQRSSVRDENGTWTEFMAVDYRRR